MVRPNRRKDQRNLRCTGFDDGIALVSFIYRSVVTKMNLFWVVFFGSGPKMYIATNFTGLLAGKNFHMALPFEASSVYGTFTAVPDCLVDVVGHVWPVDLTCQIVVHAMLAGVSHQFRVFCKGEEAWSERIRYHGLYGAL